MQDIDIKYYTDRINKLINTYNTWGSCLYCDQYEYENIGVKYLDNKEKQPSLCYM